MFIQIIRISYYDKIDVSERIDSNKTTASDECDICHFIGIFLNHISKYQSSIWNRCYNLLMISKNLNNIVILNIKGSLIIAVLVA